jgi:hypothetical protein
MSMKFGTPVRVHATAHRLKAWGNTTAQTSSRDAIRYGQVIDKRWPGVRLLGSRVDPSHPRAVMIRRIERATRTTGIVVGETWKEEGYVDAGRGNWDDGYGNALIRQGDRVHLYEVALSTKAGPNGRLPKARLELVHELDLEEL